MSKPYRQREEEDGPHGFPETTCPARLDLQTMARLYGGVFEHELEHGEWVEACRVAEMWPGLAYRQEQHLGDRDVVYVFGLTYMGRVLVETFAAGKSHARREMLRIAIGEVASDELLEPEGREG